MPQADRKSRIFARSVREAVIMFRWPSRDRIQKIDVLGRAIGLHFWRPPSFDAGGENLVKTRVKRGRVSEPNGESPEKGQRSHSSARQRSALRDRRDRQMAVGCLKKTGPDWLSLYDDSAKRQLGLGLAIVVKGFEQHGGILELAGRSRKRRLSTAPDRMSDPCSTTVQRMRYLNR